MKETVLKGKSEVVEEVAEAPVEKKVKKDLSVRWTGDKVHFNKEYGFLCSVPNERLEIFVPNESGSYEWCEVDPSDSRVVDCVEKCSARLKFK